MNSVTGKAIRGKQKGRLLGYPTVNIALAKNIKIESGVYSGSIEFDGLKYKTAVFISNNKQLLEAHILDFSGDLYGKIITIKIGKKIRDVRKFFNDEDLISQIKKDINKISNC
jgi:riboflavin kinase / FMN adenylyltransferase